MEKETEARDGGMLIQRVEKRLVLQILGPYGIPPALGMSAKDN